MMARLKNCWARNVYGWFVRVERRLYTLSEGGKAALTRWKAQLPPSTMEATPESSALLGES
jgi:hypothetical protein